MQYSAFVCLSLADVVSYRYGRGYWSPNTEVFHWFERWAWRVAVLMPIYQNCTSGHWKHGHEQIPVLGTILHYLVGAWGLGFFAMQVVCSDGVRYFHFLTGGEDETLFEQLDISRAGVDSFHPFSYHGGLVVMWILYLVLMVGGFTPFYASLEPTMKRPLNKLHQQQHQQYNKVDAQADAIQNVAHL